MKKFIALMVLGSMLFVNLSFMGIPMTQACAQSYDDTSTILSSAASQFISVVASCMEEGKKKYKEPQDTGSKDCHDELVYYYKIMTDETGNSRNVYVGKMEIKFGNITTYPPGEFDFYQKMYYKENKSYAKIECNGEATSVHCSPRYLTCEEQHP